MTSTPEQMREQRQRRYARRLAAGLCVECGRHPLKSTRLCKKCLAARVAVNQTPVGRAKMNGRAKAWYRRLREQVIDHYTQGKRACTCPGCTTVGIEFLTLDHVNNDGHKHRKKVTAGIKLFRWVITNGFPASIQVICWNCNAAKQFYGNGVCPHVQWAKARKRRTTG